jgi:hypothetical protein
MTQIPFDQLSKQYLEEFLTPLGEVTRNLEIPGESKFVDVCFVPRAIANSTIDDLGVLTRMIQTVCLLEPFRNAPRRAEVRACLLKLLWLQEDERRRAKQENRPLPDPVLPQLWVLAATVTQPVIQEVGGHLDPAWLPGIYFLPKLFRSAIVAIDQLPETEETLWLRILGRDDTQERAIREVLALPSTYPRRDTILRLLASWKVKIEVGEVEDFAGQEAGMALSEAFLEWEQATQQRAEAQGVEQGKRSLILRLLTRKVGGIPDTLRAQIEALPITQLEALGEALLDFSATADLDAWLRENQ